MGLSDYMTQIGINSVANRTNTSKNDTSKPSDQVVAGGDYQFNSGAVQGTGSGYDMSMEDFLTLIMAQYQNQDIMNPASTDEFVNQMVQLMTIQTMTNLNDISTISYAASLVGKEVTLGVPGENGMEEVVGVVTGTGMLNGQQVIFVNGTAYGLNSIMAVGRIPEEEDPVDPDFSVDPDQDVDDTEKPDEEQETDQVDGSDASQPDSTEEMQDAVG